MRCPSFVPGPSQSRLTLLCCPAGVAWQGDLRSGGCGGRRRLDDFDPGAFFPDGCRAPPPVSGTEADRARCVVARLELANLYPDPNHDPNPDPNPTPTPNLNRTSTSTPTLPYRYPYPYL